jgi:hypothetical protein
MDILKSNFETIVDLFFSANKNLIISSPNITMEIAYSLIEMHEQGVKVHVYTEFTESSFRAGFGDIKVFKQLREAGVTVFDKQSFNIYFIIIDNKGYFYFPKSLFLEKEGTSFDLFSMDNSQVKAIKFLYNILDVTDPDYDAMAQKADIEVIREVAEGRTELNEENSKELEIKLDRDPVLTPVLGRTLNVYIQRFQFVELEFTGGNLHSKKISLPAKVLPFRENNLLKLIESKLRLFSGGSGKEFLTVFFVLKKEVEYIRKFYFHHISSRNKSLIIRDDKADFINKVDRIKEQLIVLRGELLNKIQQEIQMTREAIKDNYLSFLKINPPRQFEGYKGNVLNAELENHAQKIIGSIHFPQAKELLEDMDLTYRFYDITWEDLNDEKVRNELIKKGLIEEEEKLYFDKLAIEAKVLQ